MLIIKTVIFIILALFVFYIIPTIANMILRKTYDKNYVEIASQKVYKGIRQLDVIQLVILLLCVIIDFILFYVFFKL